MRGNTSAESIQEVGLPLFWRKMAERVAKDDVSEIEGMKVPLSWLEELTLDKLHRLAVSIGSPCSGTKAVRIEGIRDAVSRASNSGREGGGLSLLSIDMGIKNLAFAHLTAPVMRSADSTRHLQYDKPTLQAWRRMAASELSNDAASPSSSELSYGSGQNGEEAAARNIVPNGKESFEPLDYAAHAYRLMKYMLQAYKPNQVVIERQRFRSGGQAAVLEWTIRVGVFEGMLYSVLRALTEEGVIQLNAEPVQPTRVNRYWLEGGNVSVSPSKKRLTGREVKKVKIDLVGKMLDRQDMKSNVRISGNLKPFTDEFVSTWKNTAKGKRAASPDIFKLDDLADCLLQGLAWIDWQNNRSRIDALGQDATDLTFT
ncbi:uncharacterized protein Z518_01714 [Rhinocladiella mackenziei CBS 650.93]|uniref:Mitochondrial resolvase Ydc2 catalytic domain-containing protein n=1 Tax=Rhinocladiella mackenziei CBS 650.93 TaxID=1442369 RepID=A0A0D2JMF1_9EURO|nr:uncharacterized protein Z518_01714 [Rhinocladiella mackenziei CBS 650.93]KIX10630.1 hypothetical protein Z518_01714 [Rhinocladiella mackenziei CBS 650.93]